VLLGQRLELAGDLGVPAEREIGLDPLLERRDVQLHQTSDLRLRERLVREVGERRPTPQRQCLAQHPRSRLGIGIARLCDELLEAPEIDLRRFDVEHVARYARPEPAGSELLAEPGDVDLDALGDRRRRRLAP
jgi:hypothetical protein